jgi:hypothetical protein
VDDKLRRSIRYALPANWWDNLHALVRQKTKSAVLRTDLPEHVEVSERTLRHAKAEGEISESSLRRMANALGYSSCEDLLGALANWKAVRPTSSELPQKTILTRQPNNPQGADYRDILIGLPKPWTYKCAIETQSPYFRFGFKLLGGDSRIFGDASIQSLEPNLVVHIGRNNWDRPSHGCSSRDIFLTAYFCGQAINQFDERLFEAAETASLEISLGVDRANLASLRVNGNVVFTKPMPPEICGRIVMIAWGDRDDFSVQVTEPQIVPEA